MALSEDLDQFLNDFGLSCTAGAVTALGILDMPGRILSADGMVISTDYSLTAKASDFGSLVYGDSITVAGIVYTVREALLIDDGAFCEISLTRLSPGQTVPGGQPRQWSLGDLSDVNLTNPNDGDALTYDGNEWKNTDSYAVGS